MTDLSGRKLGQYQLIEEVGKGGMAWVYRAIQTSIGREVAVKVLPGQFMLDDTFLVRFNREVQLAANLQHPHILPVYDFGEQDGLPYIVMAYMAGGSVLDRIRIGGGMDPFFVAQVLDQIGGALDFAHERHIIHRDFKPANILLDSHGNAYLADFGIARATESQSHLTGSGVIGTPAYMAPEMAYYTGVTHLVDVYAFGVTMFEMLTGNVPYIADTPIAVAMAHASEPIPNILELRPDLPPDVQTVVRWALEKAPEQRYQSAGQVASEFYRAITTGLQAHPTGGFATVAADQVPRHTPPRQITPRPAPGQVEAARKKKRFPILLALGVLAAAAVVTGAVLLLTGVVSIPGLDIAGLIGIGGGPTSTPTVTAGATAARTVEAVLPTDDETTTRTPALTGTVTPTPTEGPEGPTSTSAPRATTLESDTILRTGPGTEYDRVATLSNNTRVNVLGRNLDGSWLYVETSRGQTGWVRSSLLDVEVAVASLEIITELPPTPTRFPTVVTAYCGNNVCDPGESHVTCIVDCASTVIATNNHCEPIDFYLNNGFIETADAESSISFPLRFGTHTYYWCWPGTGDCFNHGTVTIDSNKTTYLSMGRGTWCP